MRMGQQAWGWSLALALAVGSLTAGEEAPAAPPAQPDAAAVANAAAEKAVKYFLSQANADGTFGKSMAAKSPGVVGLVVYGLAKAPGKRSPELQAALDKAAGYLVALQQENGAIAVPGHGLENYMTSVAVMALKALNDPKYDAVLAKAKPYILSSQLTAAQGYNKDEHYMAYGGFGYGGGKRADLSNTTFSLDALKALGMDENSEEFKNALVFVRRTQDNAETNDVPAMKEGNNSGGFLYFPGTGEFGTEKNRAGKDVPKPYGNMTYAGIKCLIYCGAKPDSPELQAAWRWIKEHYDVTQNPGGKGSEGYYYYLVAFAKAFTAAKVNEIDLGDGKKAAWAKDLALQVAKLQKPDGSWANEAERWWESDPTLATAYALIALDYAAANLAGGK